MMLESKVKHSQIYKEFMIDTASLIFFLDNLLGSHVPQQRHEVYWSCPFCHHHKPKFAVNINTGKWHCWVCEQRGRTLFSLLKKLGADRSRFRELARILGEEAIFVSTPDTEEYSLTLPSEFIPLWETSKDLEFRRAIAYLKRRGIDQTDIAKYRMGYSVKGRYRDRIIIPSYNAEGKLNFFTGRAFVDEVYPPYLNPPADRDIIGFESLISWKFNILICEGPMDAIVAKKNSIPLFGKTLSLSLKDKIILKKPIVYILLDKDALQQSINIAEELMQHDIQVHIVHLNEYKDPSEAGFYNIWNAVQRSEEITFNDITKLKLGMISS